MLARLIRRRMTTTTTQIFSGDSSLAVPSQLLRQGELVAFPTETVYGLGANALSASAVARIFAAKGRPSDNPLIVHVCDWSMLLRVADPAFVARHEPLLRQLAARFWPGALTVLLQRHVDLPDNVTAGESRVGVRVPDCDAALALIRQSDCPLAAPSANRSGRPSPTCAAHVLDDLAGRIAAIVDGGACRVGVESTVIDAFATPPLVLRPGGVTIEQLRELLPDIELYDAARHAAAHSADKPATPGLKYRHYAPNAPVTLVEQQSDDIDIADALIRCVRASPPGERVGLAYVGATTADNRAAQAFVDDSRVVLIALGATTEAVAQNLYGALRQFDDARVDAIVLQGVEHAGTGVAVLNRMRKAASANSKTEIQPGDQAVH
jgi:L-threonylcarbamoyladenylate synthase